MAARTGYERAWFGFGYCFSTGIQCEPKNVKAFCSGLELFGLRLQVQEIHVAPVDPRQNPKCPLGIKCDLQDRSGRGIPLCADWLPTRALKFPDPRRSSGPNDSIPVPGKVPNRNVQRVILDTAVVQKTEAATCVAHPESP